MISVTATRSTKRRSQICANAAQPSQRISLQSRTRNQLLSLDLSIKSTIRRNRIINALSDALLRASIKRTRTRLTTQRFRMAQSRTRLTSVHASVRSTQIRLRRTHGSFRHLRRLTDRKTITTRRTRQTRARIHITRRTLQSIRRRMHAHRRSISTTRRQMRTRHTVLHRGRRQLAFSGLGTPLDKVILRHLIRPKSLILPKSTILSLNSLSRVRIVVRITSDGLDSFGLKRPTRIHFSTVPKRIFDNSIAHVSPITSNASHLLPMRVALSGPNNHVNDNLLTQIADTPKKAADSVAIPRDTLDRNDGNRSRIFIIARSNRNLRMRTHSIQINSHDSNRTAVLTKLTSNSHCIIHDDRPLRSNRVIRPDLLSRS